VPTRNLEKIKELRLLPNMGPSRTQYCIDLVRGFSLLVFAGLKLHSGQNARSDRESRTDQDVTIHLNAISAPARVSHSPCLPDCQNWGKVAGF